MENEDVDAKEAVERRYPEQERSKMVIGDKGPPKLESFVRSLCPAAGGRRLKKKKLCRSILQIIILTWIYFYSLCDFMNTGTTYISTIRDVLIWAIYLGLSSICKMQIKLYILIMKLNDRNNQKQFESQKLCAVSFKEIWLH